MVERKYSDHVRWYSLLFLLTGSLFCIIFILGCNHLKESNGDTYSSPMRDINLVKEAHVDELMKIPGVVGVYVGQLENGTPCIGIMVIEKTEELEKKIPKTLERYPVFIDETGEIKPMNDKPE